MKNKPLLTKEAIKRLINEVASMGGMWIRLTGGEPTLNPDWEEITKYIIKKGMAPMLYSNGNFYKRENTLKKILKYNWGEFRVTIAGSKQTHESLRIARTGIVNYDEVIKTIKTLSQNRVNLKVNYTLLKNNLCDVKKMIFEIKKISIETKNKIVFHIGPLRPFGIPKGIESLLPTAEDFFILSKLIHEIQGKLRKYLEVDYDFNLFDKQHKREIAPKMFNGDCCGVGKLALAVNCFGEIQICGIMGSNFYVPGIINMIKKEEKIFGKLGINKKNIFDYSNVIKDKFKDIWFKSKQFDFFSKYEKLQCKSCKNYLKNCKGMCPAMALYYSGNMRYGDKSCFKHLM